MKHTIKAMSDLLFEAAETKAKVDHINSQLNDLHRHDDFPPSVSAMSGEIEQTLVDALDLFFEEMTDCESLATHMLYETGIVTDKDGIEYRINKRDEWDNFINKHLNPVPAYEVAGHQYLFTDPLSGQPVWRDHYGSWNGQEPCGNRELFVKKEAKNA